MVYNGKIELFSEGEFFTQVLTEDVQKIVADSGIKTGFSIAQLNHTTSSLFVLEHESGILADLKLFVERLFTDQQQFYHHDRGVDSNGKAHVLNILFASNAVIPIVDGHLSLGEYQDVVFMDFQDIPKTRTIGVYVYGEA